MIERMLRLIKGKDFWSNAENRQTNPTLVLAQILAERRDLGVSISEEAKNIFGRPEPDSVEISTSVEGRSILDRVCETSEFRALSAADRGILGEEFLGVPLDVLDSCLWPNDIKGKVRSYSWQRKAALSRARKAPETKEVQEVLGHLEIRSLLEPVVDRVLGSALR